MHRVAIKAVSLGNNMKVFLIAVLCVAGALALPLITKEESPLWTRSGRFEGDIVLTPEDELVERNGLNGFLSSLYRWSGKTIPYKLKDGHFNAEQAEKIRSALEQYNTLTCITVREATSSDKNYVLVTREDSGCWSYIGKRGGSQQLNLQDNSAGTCLVSGTIVHEFLHAAGFYHQQSASERDEYVTIVWSNIQSGKSSNFKKYSKRKVSNFNVEYDYKSVMHYDRYAFSKNGEATILPFKDPDTTLGNKEGLTASDILKLNRMYGCE